jgi:group I intron endonuclease
MVGIYKITSPTKRVYIGQAINIDNRKKDYSDYLDKRCKGQPKIYRSIKKYGWKAHKHKLIEECSLDQLDERETFHKIQFIETYGWKMALFCDLYDGGGGPRSEETKRKISNSTKGRIISLEQRQNLSKIHKGNKYNLGRIKSQEERNKISKSNKGKIVSLETREKKRMSMLGKKHTKKTKTKMSKASLGKAKSKQHIKNMMKNRQVVIEGVKKANSKPILQYDLEGNYLNEWSSITEAKRNYQCDIQGMLSGRQKTAGGFVWKFK